MIKKIALVDDEIQILELLHVGLEQTDRTFFSYTCPLKALEELPIHGADLIVTDLHMPAMNGIEFIKHCRSRLPDAKIVMLTGHGGIRDAVQAMKAGATDFFTKPLNMAEFKETVGKLLDLQDAARSERASSAGLRAVASDRPMEQALKLAAAVARRDSSVLITGETGAGKEVLADYIQRQSARAGAAYVKVNCAALPESLIESELFGHEKGAFTGAVERRAGRFERANRGTLFLDEIAELPLPLQPKLLRVLQSREIERIGSETVVKADFRMLCATHLDLAALVKQGKFREDLYYRINVFPIAVPPLRERPNDILALAAEFLRRAEKAVGKHGLRLAPDALALFARYAWPGNVRELENAIERATIIVGATMLQAADFWWLAEVPASEKPAPATAPPGSACAAAVIENPLEEAERRALVTVLQKNRWNYSQAAKELKLSRSTVYAKAAHYGIKR